MNKEKIDKYEKSKIKTSTIQIATTSPELKNKIRSNITDDSDVVTWYIRFNLELDPKTVSKKTMNVTERNGYIVKTYISYDEKNHMISILPTDCYAMNEYYLLNISKKVKSAKGTRMKKEVHVLFKLIGNQIAEFKVLKSSDELPKPKSRPRGYVPKGTVCYPKTSTTSKLYTFDEERFKKLPKDKLPYYLDIKSLNPILAAVGLITIIVGLALSSSIVIIVGLAASTAGILHILMQLVKRKMRSILLYNIGVLLFNIGQYQKADLMFQKAFRIDETNEYAEYASNKVKFYL